MNIDVNVSYPQTEMKKQIYFIKCFFMLSMAVGLVFCLSLPANARPQDLPQQPAEAQQASQDDPILQLNLTPEQRQKIRSITQENREERIRINRQLREAQFSLQETLDGDSPTEAVVEQRIRDVANAQAAQIRMRALTELRIRTVLTPDQLRIWRELRGARRQLNNFGTGRVDARPPGRKLPNRRNGIAPLFPRRARRP